MADRGVDDVLYMADGREAIAARSPDPAAAPDYLTAPDLGTFAARDGMPGTKQIPASSDPYIGGLQFSDRYVWDFGSGPHILTYYLKDSANTSWTSQQKDAFKSAMQEISNAVDLQFVEVDNEADASLIEILDNETSGALHYIPDSSTTQLLGRYNILTQAPNSDIYAGSYDYNTFIHEVGHALGLKHPFESEGDQPVFPGGQDGNFEVLGNNNFIHTMYVAMAYASGYGFNAGGAIELNNGFYLNNQYDYGYMQTPGTFDIFALQYYYGANTTYQSGNTLYTLPDVVGSPNVGAAWVTIYDTGGVDEISYTGTENAFIDLRAATADDTPTGGGMFSQVANVYGGFNIAKGILIENARGGSGDDTIIGNAHGNRIVGGGGHCPSSDNLRPLSLLRNGGSGSSGFEVKRPLRGAASGAAAGSGV